MALISTPIPVRSKVRKFHRKFTLFFPLLPLSCLSIHSIWNCTKAYTFKGTTEERNVGLGVYMKKYK